MGLTKLSEKTLHESEHEKEHEKEHARIMIERIWVFEGKPDLSKR